MIAKLVVTDFKCFQRAAFEFRPLTVLTGMNGTGKSTVIQALLLLRQAVERSGNSVVQLNGPYGLALGSVQDVLNAYATNRFIGVLLKASSGTRHDYQFKIPAGMTGSAVRPESELLHLETAMLSDEAQPQVFRGTGLEFSYLSAERLGPRDQLDVSADEPRRVGVGYRGEYTAQVLAIYESRPVEAHMLHSSAADQPGLRAQAEAWISEIIRPIRIEAQQTQGITAATIRFFESWPGGLLSDPIRPANMGFGFSYALPVVVAGLAARPGNLLIVENPEAHLHPAGQSRLGALLARVAGMGVQVVVETHSDHVLNGIRLAAVEEQAIEPEHVIMHFFGGESAADDTDSAANEGQVSTPIELNGRGGLTLWPEGFFDQMEIDLGRLARVRRSA